MLAFIVLLLLGLAAFTRVETAVAGNTQRQAQARENALLGLNIAVAQLQKYAGPDTRVTATAEGFSPAPASADAPPASVNVQKVHYTGVWDTTSTSTTPVAWLVSGMEATGTLDDVTQAVPTAQRIALVGANTDGSATANNTAVALQDIKTTGVPGVAATTAATIGRYAWWVGDQGVKAPVAAADNTGAIDYAPYKNGSGTDLRDRIAQQTALGAGAASASAGTATFEPRDANNAPLVADNKVSAPNQLAFLRTSGTAQVGAATLRTNFHAWAPNNFAVLANTKTGGLRQDLSLKPDVLGTAFAAWANYTTYMEDPAGSGTSTLPAIVPSYSDDPLRRRYFMQAEVKDDSVRHSVAPVLSYFLLSFNVRTDGGSQANAPLQVRARWMFSLWNPYTAALVPENLRLEISDLPTSIEVHDETTDTAVANVQLGAVYGSSLKIKLPWDAAGSVGNRSSWLPGRVHTWTALEDLGSGIPSAGFDSKFNSRNLNADAGQGVQRSAGGTPIDGNTNCTLRVTIPRALTARLYAVRADGDVPLATFTSPQFGAFTTTAQNLSQGTYQFSYLFRLAEGIDTPDAPETWLLGPRRDPRRSTLGASAFVAGPNGPQPELYPNYVTIDAPDRLLDRGSESFDEDTPVFELPRSPLLSVGSLQHLSRVNRRAFGIGNSWGRFGALNGVPMSELFDRYFFSGVATGVTPSAPAGTLVLPNPLLRMLRNPDTGAAVTADQFQGAPDARSSKFVLQGGAFNLNSTSAAAWAAILRGVRFPAPQSFRFLAAAADTGTAADTATGSVQSTDAQFFRFAQSAQETYQTADGDTSVAKTANYRKGMRTLTATQVSALAGKIASLVKARQASLGPFRSLEEFLQPLPDSITTDDEQNVSSDTTSVVSTFGQSLLERAIANAGVNADFGGFSSQWLTQADIMTELAPVLFARSDTFVVRAYGEAVNPATSATEGRAWCEALVQRVPEYFDRSDSPETAASAFDAPGDPNDSTSAPTAAHQLNKAYGRRFKVISFRWLTKSDI